MPYRNQQPPVTPSNAKALTTWIYLMVGFIFLLTIPRIFWGSTSKFFKVWWEDSTSGFLITLFVVYAAKWSADVVSAISKVAWNPKPLATKVKISIEDREEKKQATNSKGSDNEHQPSFFVFHVMFSLLVFYITSHWILIGGYTLVIIFLIMGVLYSMGSSILNDFGWRKIED